VPLLRLEAAGKIQKKHPGAIETAWGQADIVVVPLINPRSTTSSSTSCGVLPTILVSRTSRHYVVRQ
jgi:hypothetical protein